MPIDRRSFLQMLSAGALSASSLNASFAASICRALEIPGDTSKEGIKNVEHIIFLMQENRSFDHYFGTLNGVRGFNDPRAVTLSTGNSVFYQPNPPDSKINKRLDPNPDPSSPNREYVLPYRPTGENLGLQFFGDLSHDWKTTHEAWNNGNYDKWVAYKGEETMAYLTRSDIPFHYALADAFTICDAYHCSVMGPTHPNRHHMWSGWVGNDGKKGGPLINNNDGEDDGHLESNHLEPPSWKTYPERLNEAKVFWKIYQDLSDDTNGNSYVGGHGDNMLMNYKQYRDPLPGSPLPGNAAVGTNVVEKAATLKIKDPTSNPDPASFLFEDFQTDVMNDKLPQVSWIVSPLGFSEHPVGPANYGAWYVSQILDILTAKPEIWSKTVFFLMYDENDGFFDHMVPPTPAFSKDEGASTVETTDEFYKKTKPHEPYGLGPRVPMLVISPWSKGGWVNSQVFDHTSLIRFIEKRFGPHYDEKDTCKVTDLLKETNITEWRRAITGDLTSAFDFTVSDKATATLPSTDAYRRPLDKKDPPAYIPPPPGTQSLPAQEPGIRQARGLPYRLNVDGLTNLSERTVTLNFYNTGDAAAVFHVRSGNANQAGPWSITAGAGTEETGIPKNSYTWPSYKWKYEPSQDEYDLSVYGPNGFFRKFKGNLKDSVKLEVTSSIDPAENRITLQLVNGDTNSHTVYVQNAYGNEMDAMDKVPAPAYPAPTYTATKVPYVVDAGKTSSISWIVNSSYGWYDFTITSDADQYFQRQIAGHIETGKDSITDPAIGKPITA